MVIIMRQVWNEVKKILNGKVLLIIGIITVLYYLVFLDVTYPNGYPATTNCELAAELIQRVGPSMGPEERMVLDEIYMEWQPIWNQIIEEDADFWAEYAVYTYDDFVAQRQEFLWAEENNDTTASNASAELFIEKSNEIIFETHKEEAFMHQSIEYLKEVYDEGGVINLTEAEWKTYWQEREANFKAWGISEGAKEREHELRTRESLSLLPYETIEYYMQNLSYFAGLLVITCLLLVVPYCVQDRLSRMESLMLTTRAGRRLIKKQMAAVLICSLLFSLLNIMIFWLVLHSKNISVFHDCNIVTSITDFWFDFTFKNYMFITLGLVLLLGIGAGMIAFYVSKVSANYIAAIAISIPVSILLVLVSIGVTMAPFRMTRQRGAFHQIYWLAGFLLVALAGAALFRYRERKRQL